MMMTSSFTCVHWVTPLGGEGRGGEAGRQGDPPKTITLCQVASPFGASGLPFHYLFIPNFKVTYLTLTGKCLLGQAAHPKYNDYIVFLGHSLPGH